MENMHLRILLFFTLIILGLIGLFWGLVMAKEFLAPLAVAGLLTMVILPVSNWLERKGFARAWASLFSTLLFMLFFLLIAGIIGLQVKKFTEEWPQIAEEIKPKIEQLQQYIADKTGITIIEQQRHINSTMPFNASDEASNSDDQNGQSPQEESGGKSMLSTASAYVLAFFGFLGTFLLTLIYIFFFLLYRKKFSMSLLKMAPKGEKEKTRKIITDSVLISQHYLSGRLILILFLAIMYSIGLTISGIEQAILIAVLASILTLLPYIGNLIGYVLAVGMAIFSGASGMAIIGISITFAITQFVESYILEPYVVGEKVHINPVFTVIVVVLGGAVWGVLGMVLAIPVLGIIKVVFDQVPVLQPLGYLFGEEDTKDKSKEDSGIFHKIKEWVASIMGKK